MGEIIKFTAVGKYDVGTIFEAKYRDDKKYSNFVVIKVSPSDWTDGAVEVTAEEFE